MIVFSFALASGFFWLWLWVVGLRLRDMWLWLRNMWLWLRDRIRWNMWNMWNVRCRWVVIDHWSGLFGVHVSTEGCVVDGIENCKWIITMAMVRRSRWVVARWRVNRWVVARCGWMIWLWFRWVIRLWLWVNWFWFWMVNLFQFERVKDSLNINSGEVLASKGVINKIVFLLQLVLFHHILTLFLWRLRMFLYSRLGFRVIMRFWSRLGFRVVMRLWSRLGFRVVIRFWFRMMIRLGMIGLRVVIGLWMVRLWVIWFHLCWESWPVEP